VKRFTSAVSGAFPGLEVCDDIGFDPASRLVAVAI